jgi:hypothetical protein
MFSNLRCSEDSFRVGKQGSIWDNGDTWDDAIWASSNLNCKGSLRFQEKKCHNFLLTTSFCVNERILVAYDGRELYRKSKVKKIKK